MITIEVYNNNKFRVRGDLKFLNKLFEAMKVRHPNAYWLRPYMEPGWDGKIKYLSDQGYGKMGLLPMVTRVIEELGGEYIIEDRRKLLEYGEIVTEIGEFTARDYQIEAVENILYNDIDGIPFQRGVIAAATNAGKTLIAAMVHKSFKDARTIILVNNKDLYQQFLDDMPKMFGDNWGYMQGPNLKWGDIMVCMTPTLNNRLVEYKNKLATYNVVVFDECHLITSKTNKKVITYLFNSSVRIGLSGTPFAHKDKTKNMDVRAFFGDVVYEISNIELMNQGYSTPIVVKVLKGNTIAKVKGDYPEEYRQGITLSRERTKKSLRRSKFYLDRGLYPILITGRYHEHVERLYKAYQAKFGYKYRIAFIHHKIKNRKDILDRFKKGEIDILISSLIIKLGQNMPLIKYMQNAAGGDSQINALQLIGRAIRIHSSKSKVYYEDFFDEGFYLKRHSKHRLQYYKHQRFKVLELYKNEDTIIK